MGVFGLLRGFAPNYETFLLFQFLMAVGHSATMPCLPTIAAEWFPPEKAGFAVGVSISGFALGDIIALNATPYLLTLLNGWRGAISVYGVWAVILAAIWWIFAREPTQHEIHQSNKPPSTSSTRKTLAMLLKVREVWLLAGLYFTSCACYDTILLWLTSISETEGTVMAGLITSMLPLGFLLASFGVGSLSDKIGLRKPFILLLGLASGPVIYAIGVLHGPALWIAAFLSGFCIIGVLAVLLAIPVEHPLMANNVGSAVALITSFGNIGSLVMATLVGYLRDVTGSFLWGIVILAILGESMLIIGLPLTETGRKRR
jgi:MFS family permease